MPYSFRSAALLYFTVAQSKYCPGIKTVFIRKQSDLYDDHPCPLLMSSALVFDLSSASVRLICVGIHIPVD
jgi:hypothetical protein